MSETDSLGLDRVPWHTTQSPATLQVEHSITTVLLSWMITMICTEIPCRIIQQPLSVFSVAVGTEESQMFCQIEFTEEVFLNREALCVLWVHAVRWGFIVKSLQFTGKWHTMKEEWGQQRWKDNGGVTNGWLRRLAQRAHVYPDLLLESSSQNYWRFPLGGAAGVCVTSDKHVELSTDGSVTTNAKLEPKAPAGRYTLMMLEAVDLQYWLRFWVCCCSIHQTSRAPLRLYCKDFTWALCPASSFSSSPVHLPVFCLFNGARYFITCSGWAEENERKVERS